MHSQHLARSLHPLKQVSVTVNTSSNLTISHMGIMGFILLLRIFEVSDSECQ